MNLRYLVICPPILFSFALYLLSLDGDVWSIQKSLNLLSHYQLHVWVLGY